MEEREITLPLAGETELTIIRTRPGIDGTMDNLERAVRGIEEFMGYPFPQRQVIYLFASAPGGGVNRDSHVHIRADEQHAQGIMAHEAAHWYWDVGPRWLKEGAAVYVEYSVLDGSNLERFLHRKFSPCTLVQTISELEALEPDGSFAQYDCTYTLLPMLLDDLSRVMNEITFRQAFRRLFLHTRFDVPSKTERCEGDGSAICLVREAFAAYADSEIAATVEDIITRWYGRPGDSP